jgi:hypothetical protein
MIINLQQRLQGQSSKSDIRPEDSDIILDAANNITRLVEDAMIYWSPECFPMIWYVARCLQGFFNLSSIIPFNSNAMTTN